MYTDPSTERHRPPLFPATPAPAAGGRKGRVLVVDDELPLLRMYARILTARGFDVVTAADGLQASELVEKDGFDVIVSDVCMPGLDGLGLLRAVRRVDADVPMVVTTGAPTGEGMDQAAEAGALLYLGKPVEPRALVQIVESARHTGAAARQRRLRLGGAPAASLGGALEGVAELSACFERALGSVAMVYQPIVAAASGAVFGYEALLRTAEPAFPHPGVMLEAAERLGRTWELGRLVRERVALAAADAPPGAHLFVNLHPADLRDPQLYAPSAPLSCVAGRVVLELTERAPLDGVEDVAARVAALRALGFRVAVDDLGAGYASLTVVAELRPDVVKIDAAIVRGVGEDAVKRRIVEAVVSLCRGLDVAVVAEGVESRAERDVLAALGCPLMQGYLLGRPRPAFQGPQVVP